MTAVLKRLVTAMVCFVLAIDLMGFFVAPADMGNERWLILSFGLGVVAGWQR